jgi:hypothetical protein
MAGLARHTDAGLARHTDAGASAHILKFLIS